MNFIKNYFRARRRKKAKRRSKKRKSASKRFFKTTKKSNLKNRIVVVLVLLGILATIGWFGYSLYRFFSFDFLLAYKDERLVEEEKWRGEDRLHILLVGLDRRGGEYAFVDSLNILMIDPRDHIIGVYNINVDTSVIISKERGYEKLRNIYNSELIDGNVPIDGVVSASESLLSISIDRYIVSDESSLKDLVDEMGGIWVNSSFEFVDDELKEESEPYQFRAGAYRLGGSEFVSFLRSDANSEDERARRHLSGIEGLIRRFTNYIFLIKFPYIIEELETSICTNLTKNEALYLFRVIYNSHELRSDYMTKSNLRPINSGGETIYIAINERLDRSILEVFLDNRVIKEQARVEVFNSTSKRGFASFRSRWLRNIGIDVIRTGDTRKPYQNTTIYITDEEDDYSDTIFSIEKIFNEDIEVKRDTPDFIHTGDLVVVIGANAL